jgi:hypothetical protein
LPGGKFKKNSGSVENRCSASGWIRTDIEQGEHQMRKMIILALAAAAVAAPAAAMGHDGNRGHFGAPPVVSYEFVGTVTSNAGADSVEVGPVRGVNRHARRSLAGATSFTVKLGGLTSIRVRAAGATPWWEFAKGTSADLRAGDRVRIEIRAPRGTAAADLPAAARVRDFTMHTDPVPPPPPPPAPPAPPVVDPGAGGGPIVFT